MTLRGKNYNIVFFEESHVVCMVLNDEQANIKDWILRRRDQLYGI